MIDNELLSIENNECFPAEEGTLGVLGVLGASIVAPYIMVGAMLSVSSAIISLKDKKEKKFKKKWIDKSSGIDLLNIDEMLEEISIDKDDVEFLCLDEDMDIDKLTLNQVISLMKNKKSQIDKAIASLLKAKETYQKASKFESIFKSDSSIKENEELMKEVKEIYKAIIDNNIYTFESLIKSLTVASKKIDSFERIISEMEKERKSLDSSEKDKYDETSKNTLWQLFYETMDNCAGDYNRDIFLCSKKYNTQKMNLAKVYKKYGIKAESQKATESYIDFAEEGLLDKFRKKSSESNGSSKEDPEVAKLNDDINTNIDKLKSFLLKIKKAKAKADREFPDQPNKYKEIENEIQKIIDENDNSPKSKTDSEDLISKKKELLSKLVKTYEAQRRKYRIELDKTQRLIYENDRGPLVDVEESVLSKPINTYLEDAEEAFSLADLSIAANKVIHNIPEILMKIVDAIFANMATIVNSLQGYSINVTSGTLMIKICDIFDEIIERCSYNYDRLIQGLRGIEGEKVFTPESIDSKEIYDLRMEMDRCAKEIEYIKSFFQSPEVNQKASNNLKFVDASNVRKRYMKTMQNVKKLQAKIKFCYGQRQYIKKFGMEDTANYFMEANREELIKISSILNEAWANCRIKRMK